LVTKDDSFLINKYAKKLALEIPEMKLTSPEKSLSEVVHSQKKPIKKSEKKTTEKTLTPKRKVTDELGLKKKEIKKEEGKKKKKEEGKKKKKEEDKKKKKKKRWRDNKGQGVFKGLKKDDKKKN